MTQQQPDSDSPNWDVLDELDSARKQAALRVSEAPDWSCLSEPSERLKDDLIREQPLDDAYYDDSIMAAAYLKEYHVPHCIMAYCAFGELFGYFDRLGDPDELYVRDVGAGTGAARVGLALALLEREKERKEYPSTIYFDAFEPSRAMRAAGDIFADHLSGRVGEIVASFDYHDDYAAGQTCRKCSLPLAQPGTQRVVTAFHLSLPYHNLLRRGDYIEAAQRARSTIQSALRLVSPHIGLFTVNSKKKDSLAWAVCDPDRWTYSKPHKLDDIRRDGIISDFKLPLPNDAVLLWRVSRHEERRQAAQRAEEKRRAEAERAAAERRQERRRRERAEQYNKQGLANAAKGEYHRAIQDYDQALRRDPNSVAAYNNRGIACAVKGDYDQAIRDYDQAIQIDPSLVATYNNRGIAYKCQGGYDRAIQDFDQAIRLNPRFAAAYRSRGSVYAAKGDYDQAKKDFHKALELGCDRAKVKALLAELP